MDGKVELMPLSPAETPVAFGQMAEPVGRAVTIPCKLPINAFGLTSLLPLNVDVIYECFPALSFRLLPCLLAP